MAPIQTKDRVFLVTGGTSGVGKAVATGLARLGAKVVIVSRTEQGGHTAQDTIARASGNDRTEFLVADLADQASIRRLSEEYKRKYDNLHVLANLAGAISFEKTRTKDGLDMTFAVNYLGHFLLTNLMLDVLKESAPSRVVTVAGAPRFIKSAKIHFDDIQFDKQFNGLNASAQAMYARVLFTFELAKRLEGTGVTANAFHPGLVKSNLVRKAPPFLKMLTSVMNALAKADCAVGVELSANPRFEKISGAFFNDKMDRVPSIETYDRVSAEKLWSISEALTKP